MSVDKDDEDDGKSGQGGHIAFKDFLDTGADKRDDLRSPEELKHLTVIHKEINERNVKKQKDKRQQYKDLKAGRIPLQAYREGKLAAAGGGQFKAFPKLADKAQFGGVEINTIPSEERLSEANQEQRDELRNELRNELSFRFGHQPRFDPRPRGPGG